MIEIIKDFDFKKKYGQNFLIDENIIQKIISLSDIKEDTLVIEIGCGAGALTKEIKKRTNLFLGYEIDKSLEQVLNKLDNNIIYDDFLKRDIKNDISTYNYKQIYIISNLPYYITTPIIEKIIEEDIVINKLIIMIQKEAKDRFMAKPNSKEYSALSVFLNYYFDISNILNVNRNSFIPKPNVDSVVLKFEIKEKLERLNNPELFFKLVKDSFKQRRKTLKNNLKNYNYKKIEEILLNNGFKESVRAEQIPMEVYIEIANNI